uniref:G-protein coupled receptors family 1 profile domain-containing protein n=1 Tax=Knipowitschia caucasica TaxID=637954 RepID=A0AAV2MNI9_KNICA
MSNSSEPWTGVPLSVDFSRPEHYLLFLFQLLFASCTVLVAGSVAVSILATRALRLQNRFLFMLNTSVCDTLVGLSVFYVGLFDVYEGYPSRNGTFYILNSLMGINILTFMFAQFDRFNSLCTPSLYVWGSPALRQVLVHAVWGRVCLRCNRRIVVKMETVQH